MENSGYDLEEFIENNSFIDYVIYNRLESREYWEQWLKENPNKQKQFDLAVQVVQSLKVDEKEFTDAELNSYFDELKKKQNKVVKTDNQKFVDRFVLSYSKIAAAVLILLVAGLWFYMDPFYQVKDDTNHPIAYIEKSNTKGIRSVITLKDGSKVHLNAESSLKIPEFFTDSSRHVILEGEAFFEIVRDEKRPFVVKTGDVQTKVLGTTFNINNRVNEQLQIALVTGKVEVSHVENGSPVQKVLLEPLQMVEYDSLSRNMEKKKFDPMEIVSWKDGIIYFNDASVAEFTTTLERWYGVKFIVDDRVDFGRGYTSTFENVALKNVLEGMEYSTDFTYKINGDTVYIKK